MENTTSSPVKVYACCGGEQITLAYFPDHAQFMEWRSQYADAFDSAAILPRLAFTSRGRPAISYRVWAPSESSLEDGRVVVGQADVARLIGCTRAAVTVAVGGLRRYTVTELKIPCVAVKGWRFLPEAEYQAFITNLPVRAKSALVGPPSGPQNVEKSHFPDGGSGLPCSNDS